MKKHFLTLFLLSVAAACSFDSSVPDGRIRVKNDSQDREYNVLQVYGGGASFSLKPGEGKLLPMGTTQFTLRREYKDHAREYDVSCQQKITSGITVKMIDAHLNRIAGGCTTTSARKI